MIAARILREPLLHFLALGACIFLFHAWRHPESTPSGGDDTVRIGAGEIAWLQATWRNQWLRDPTPQELRGLVTDYLKEELMAREARALGLEENDTIVRRRLAQKLEFLVRDVSLLAEPSEEDLRTFHAMNATVFTEPKRLSFSHIYWNPEKTEDAKTVANEALEDLLRGRAPVSVLAMSDPILLDSEFDEVDEQTVGGLFGPDFARFVFGMRPGSWEGPVESAYGVHIVRVSRSTPGGLLPFEEVRPQVLDRWNQWKQDRENEDYLASLRKKYDVVLDDAVAEIVGPLTFSDSTGAGLQ